ncbi:na+/h+ antiporter nhaa type [hydrocarbon metagenome]|uniref:Na+/h+ antiporter nhaa type n=1 Tax=hydrocarbon metagenome TaxID=938273 RepID=A0A0W8E4D0_9ZZZZ
MKENTNHLFRHIMKPVSKFVDGKMLGSVLLLVAAIIAFAWANSGYSNSYFALWNTPVAFSIGEYVISESLGHWVNDGLMVIFFFVIGLEIKREVLVGELSSVQKAALPAVAALGGMLVPAIIYGVINQGGPGSAGWGIPMATDIAFSLGCLLVLGSLIPLSLKVFLLALAIVDDLGAILVIALFYTDKISMVSLSIGILILLVSILLNKKGVRKTYPYVLLGIALWVAFLLSGIHATIAGVLLALTIPARARYDQEKFRKETNNIIQEFPEKDFRIMMVDEAQRSMMHKLKYTVDNMDTPLQKLEDNLYPLVSYFIIPIFALANAGVNMAQGSEGTSLINPISIGIIAGLFLGKQLGITLFAWLAVKLGLALLPEKVDWSQIWAVSCLAGIGFTMSLFITNLAFVDSISIYQAKIAIIIGSILSAVLGIAIFLFSGKRNAGKDQMLRTDT